MEKEQFIKKVSLLDKKQGNFQNTLKLMEKGEVDRFGYLSKYPDNAIDFFEWDNLDACLVRVQTAAVRNLPINIRQLISEISTYK